MIGEVFRGHYQTEAYIFDWQRGGQLVSEPVSLLNLSATATAVPRRSLPADTSAQVVRRSDLDGFLHRRACENLAPSDA